LELPGVLKTIRIKFVPLLVKKFVVCACRSDPAERRKTPTKPRRGRKPEKWGENRISFGLSQN
jgi:hypothetical protein